MVRNFLKGFAKDVLSDADEFLDIAKELISEALDSAQDRLLDLTHWIDRL